MGPIISNNHFDPFQIELFLEEDDEIDFAEVRAESERKFNEQKLAYPDLFNCAAIRKAAAKEKFPETIDVDQDDTAVEYISNCDSLSCWGVNFYLAVLARGISEKEPCIALSFTGEEPEQRLQKIIKDLEDMGCDKNSIEIFIVGGQLPYLNKAGEIDESMLEEEKFLELSDRYPIKGVVFNQAEEEEESLRVYITKNEVIWGISNRDDSSSEEESIKRKLEEDEDGMNKKPRYNSFGSLLKGEAPKFV